MNANELRLGNWVNYRDDNLNLEFKPIEIGVADIVSIDAACDNMYYEPIPLTEQILIDCGFKKWYFGSNLFLAIGNDSFLMSGGDSVWIDKVIGDDEHSVGLGGATALHQLQNLYYSLTGQELTYNPTT